MTRLVRRPGLLCLLVTFLGLWSQPAASGQTTLVAAGSVWNYLDTGVDPGADWMQPSFDDSGWPRGPAQLGYGDGDEATLIDGGPDTNRVITTYFRRAFDLADRSAFTNLLLRLLRDDGAIVYLNGTEIFRSNMPTGAVDSATFALDTVGNDQESEFFQWPVDAGWLETGRNLLAVEVHQVNPTSSDLSFDLELKANLPPSNPRVSIFSPENDARFAAPATVSILAAASDEDGYVTEVEFYVDGAPIASVPERPYQAVAHDLTAGFHALTAVAVDNSLRHGTSAPVLVLVTSGAIVTALVPANSVWKYLDDGSDQSSAWKGTGFDDAAWPEGPGKLGYSDNAVTVLNSGPLGDRIVTHYFRHSFVAGDPSAFTNLLFRVLRDDGVVVYLNGTEAFRMNMPAGQVDYLTLAQSPVGDTNEFYYFPRNVNPSALVSGTNILAVELHQNSPNTPDAGFDLALDGEASPRMGPRLHWDRIGADLWLDWVGSDYVLQAVDEVTGRWSDVIPPVKAGPYRVDPVAARRFYRLRLGP
jgi:Bacterial Ig domain